MPNLRDKTWTTTTPANVEDAQFWEDHLISDADSTKLRDMEGVPSGGTAGQVLTRTTSTSAPIAWADPASSGHTIQDANGNVMPYQEILQFEGADVSNDATNGKTVVDCHGQKGDAATIQVGTVTTLPPGSPATVTNSGTSSAAVFDFGIPSGADGGSTIKVTTTETTLRGKNITLTGSTTLTATFDSNGVATFTGVTMTGTLTLYTSDGTNSATKAISVPYFGNYEETISFWSAIINVTATGINGVTVYAKKNGVTAASATVTNGSASLTVNSTGTYSIELTVNPGADDEYTYSESVTVSAESTYSVSLSIFITTLAISTTSTELYSQTITVTKGGSTVGTTAFSAQGAATFRVHETGTYTLTCTYSGDDYSSEITIVNGDNGQTKTISIETDLKLADWLTEAGLDPSDYSTFADVETDEKAVRKLMTLHDSVDYLATAKADDPLINQIINSNICAKWINLRDYALDTLYSNSNIASVMDEADKYFYGEWVKLSSSPETWGPKGNVPIMTSDTQPFGNAIAAGVSENAAAWKVFDGLDTASEDAWYHATKPTWVGYGFLSPICVRRYKIKQEVVTPAFFTKYKLQGSNDADFSVIEYESSEQIVANPSAGDVYTHDVNNTKYCLFWRVYFSAASGAGVSVQTLQFYGREMKALSASMTANSMSFGAVIPITTITDAYKMFNGNITDGATKTSNTDPMVCLYDFKCLVNVKAMVIRPYVSSTVHYTFKMIYSDDGTTYTELTASKTTPLGTDTTGPYNYVVYDTDASPHRYWGIKVSGDIAFGWSPRSVYFNGVDYSEYDWDASHPRRYLIDHGIEFETISKIRGGGGIMPYYNKDELKLEINGGTNGYTQYSMAYPENAIDFANNNYSVMVRKYGAEMLNSDGTGTYSSTGGLYMKTSKTPSASNSSYNETDVDGQQWVKLPAYSVYAYFDISNYHQSRWPYLIDGYWTKVIASYAEWWLE